MADKILQSGSYIYAQNFTGICTLGSKKICVFTWKKNIVMKWPGDQGATGSSLAHLPQSPSLVGVGGRGE